MSKPPVTELLGRIRDTRRLYGNEEKVFEAAERHRLVFRDLPKILRAVEDVSELKKPDDATLERAGYLEGYKKACKTLRSNAAALDGVKTKAREDAENLRTEAVDLGEFGVQKHYARAFFFLGKAKKLRGMPEYPKNAERYIKLAFTLRSSIRALRVKTYILRFYYPMRANIKEMCNAVLENPEDTTRVKALDAKAREVKERIDDMALTDRKKKILGNEIFSILVKLQEKRGIPWSPPWIPPKK